MPEIGRDDREYWLKMLMGLAVEAHRLSEKLRDEELLFDSDGTVRENKMAVYRFECECVARNARLIQSATLSAKQRQIMKLRYIKKKPWGDIFQRFSPSLKYVYSVHKRALWRILSTNKDEDFKAEYHAEKARLNALNPYTSEYE